MKLNEIKRLQQLAGINEIRVSDPTSFEVKAQNFIEQHADIINDAFNSWRFGFSDDSVIQTVYSYLEDELGEDWTTQISTPTPEEEKDYAYGWTDEKDEIFTDAVRAFLTKDKNYNLDEIRVSNSSIETVIKNFILNNTTYTEADFEEHYNADSGLDDLVEAGEFIETAFLELNSTEAEEELLDLIKHSSKTQHNDWGDYYQNSWELKSYPFEDKPDLNWTEVLMIELQIPNGNYDVANVFNNDYSSYIRIDRSIPFDQDMAVWWIQHYG
jgi:hypothetical protein